MNLCPHMVKIRVAKEAQNFPLDSVKMENKKIGCHHVLSLDIRDQDLKFHESGTFGSWVKCEQTDRQTDKIHVL